jgi:hypothetical protein
LALLSGAWTAALTTGGLATASSEQPFGERPVMPEVPTTPFEVPASVQVGDTLPSGIDPNAGPDGTVSTLSSNGIPTAALLAYQHAATVLERADASCQLDWPLVAAIGRVESDHGRFGGNVLSADGVARPGIYGVPLDGSGNTAEIRDTDSGVYDRDRVWDRAVGPMQFIPGTWDVVGVDADGDGLKNPQDIDDASLATAVYLCAGGGDLSSDVAARAAVFRYNHSTSYVDLVLKIADAYTNGDYTMVPNSTGSPTVLTDVDNDYQRPAKADDRRPRGHEPRQQSWPGGGGGGGDTNDNNGGQGGGDANNSDGDGNGTDRPNDDDGGGNGGDNDGDGGNKPKGGDKAKDGGGDVADTGVDPVDDTTDPAEKATTYCTGAMADADLNPNQIEKNLDKCTKAYKTGGEDAADAVIEAIVATLGDVVGLP